MPDTRETNSLLLDDRLEDVFDEIRDEYKLARREHGPMTSAHNGYAVTLEELNEALYRIKAGEVAKGELLQVATMAIAFLLEVKE